MLKLSLQFFLVSSYPYIGCSFKFILKVGIEESIANAPRITDQITNQLFQSNLTFWFVCILSVQTDEWCVHNRLFNAKFQTTSLYRN
jgi:hypothetical protein